MLPSDAPPADRQPPPPPAPISLPAPPAPAIQHDGHEEDDGSDGRSWGGDPLDDDMMEEDDACGSSDDEMGLRGDDDDFCWDDAPIVAETEIERRQTAPTAAGTGTGAGEVRQEAGGGHGGGQDCVSERLGGACGWMAKIVDFTTAEKMDQDGHRFYDAGGSGLLVVGASICLSVCVWFGGV